MRSMFSVIGAVMAVMAVGAGCSSSAPKLKLQRVILYQNGIGYFERTGVVGGDRLVLGFSRHRLELDETAWIPYALDSGTTVTMTASTTERPVRIVSIHRGVLTVENAGVRTTKYTIAAGRQAPRQILPPARQGERLHGEGSAARDARSGRQRPRAAPDPGRQDERAGDREREPRRRTIELVSTRAELAAYVAGQALPAGVGGKLGAAIALRKEMAALEDDVATARGRFNDVVQRAQELRDSLRALDKVQGADDLRKKLVAGLRETTTESDTLTRTIEGKTVALTTARGRLQDAIRELVLEEPKP
jgi:hypothetical protein